MGRFLQPDPIRYNAGLNLYRYALNSPLKYRDPLGLQLTGDSITIRGGVSVSRDQIQSILEGAANKTGPNEYSAALMQDGGWSEGNSFYVGQLPSGDYLSLSMGQYLGAISVGWNEFVSAVHNAMASIVGGGLSEPAGLALLIHTHNLGDGLDTYNYSQTDINTLNSLGLPGLIITQDGLMIYHAPGSNRLGGDGCFDWNGNFHRTLYDENGNPYSEAQTSDPTDIHC